jgi:glycine/D-amino acid oxidase-like deaminating enzyme
MAGPRDQRRRFLRQGARLLVGAAATGAGAVAAAPLDEPAGKPPFASLPPLVPIRAQVDRIIDIAVCTRPFRAQGPRIEAEVRHGRTIVHNYGHGGSGWSLSWGSAYAALPLVLAGREKRIAVVGCGAIGLTTALVAQRAGLRVRIYCRERPPDVRSSAATGWWSPDSRICTTEHATAAWTRQWEVMARRSHRVFQGLLGLPGDPVEWCDGYSLSDVPFDQPHPGAAPHEAEPDYPALESALLRDLRPRSVALQPHEHPFPVPHARRFTQLVFNLGAYSRLLLDDFLREGGEIQHRHFESLRQLAALPERVVVNATGYGARALCKDESIVPVRGQTARLVPQPEVRYGLIHRGHNLVMVPRREGLLVQAQGEGDFGNPDDRPDRALSEAAVQRLARLFPAA